MQQLIFTAIVAIIIISFLWEMFFDYLTSTRWKLLIPSELTDIVDETKYNKSIEYQKAKMKLSVISSIISLVFMLAILFFGGFQWLYESTKALISNVILLNLAIIGFFFLVQSIVSLPISYYSTFVIEQKFGFNKSTKALFFLDYFKGLLLGVAIGAPILALIIWFYTLYPTSFWIIALAVVASFLIFITFFYTTLIVPIFNKLTPLSDGSLKESIESFAQKVDVQLNSVSMIDGSKRSSKANAYFSGFGKKKRIVLYDTLLNQMNEEEVVAVLAHEVGHYKHKHVIKGMVFGLFTTAIMFYIFSLFVGNPLFVQSVGVEESSFAIGIIIFTILFEPVSAVIGLIQTVMSRKNEYQADAYAASHGYGNQLISGLKKLHVENFSNINPHPLVVFFEYSHPPLIQRIGALKEAEGRSQ